MTGMSDAAVNLLDTGASLLPVVAEFCLARHGPLIPSQPLFMRPEAMQRFDERSIAQGSKAGNAHVDADDTGGRMHRLFDFAHGLDRGVPLARHTGHRDVLGLAQNSPAVAVADPAQLRQEDATVGLIDLEPLRETEAVGLTFLLETRKGRPFLEEVLVGARDRP